VAGVAIFARIRRGRRASYIEDDMEGTLRPEMSAWRSGEGATLAHPPVRRSLYSPVLPTRWPPDSSSRDSHVYLLQSSHHPPRSSLASIGSDTAEKKQAARASSATPPAPAARRATPPALPYGLRHSPPPPPARAKSPIREKRY
jgi:hypothetical protein